MSNHKADTKPAPGSYEEFHATILNQIRRYAEDHEEAKVNFHAPDTHRLLANDVAGNLWQGFIQEQRSLIADLVEALGWFLEDDRFDTTVGGNPNVVPKMFADARASLRRAREAGYGRA